MPDERRIDLFNCEVHGLQRESYRRTDGRVYCRTCILESDNVDEVPPLEPIPFLPATEADRLRAEVEKHAHCYERAEDAAKRIEQLEAERDEARSRLTTDQRQLWDEYQRVIRERDEARELVAVPRQLLTEALAELNELRAALREIANYEDTMGGPPPDDAMRDIARAALADEVEE